MATTDIHPSESPPAPERDKRLSEGTRPPGAFSDRIFRWLALCAGLLVLAILALIAISTTGKALPWFRDQGLFHAVFADDWDPAKGHFGAGGLLYGTLLVGTIAMIIAIPISIGIALFVTEVCPRRARRPIIYTIDLLAAVPSVVFGLWALNSLSQPTLVNAYSWISDATSGIPIVRDLTASPAANGLSYMTAGIIVGFMVTPIVTSLVREVFATCPPAQKEAALALGATRWEMIRGAVFPHSRSGIVAASMIGLGRALGETIAVALVIGSSPSLSEHLFGPGQTMAGIIPSEFGEASGTHRSALIGLGVVLFVVTIAIGILARSVLARSDRRRGIA
jgi:phosphate transport system permease protein